MKTTTLIAMTLGLCILFAFCAVAQEAPAPEATPDAPAAAESGAGAMIDEAATQAKDLVLSVEESETAKEYTAGILQPIYKLAEYLSFPAIHWVAFALMATGVVSFALQLVLGKLVVLSRLGFSMKECLSDAMGLAVSLLGLVLTTQAATENSSFTQSPIAVLSAAGVGVVLGFVFYAWGQSQEIEAARGRSLAAQERAKAVDVMED